MLSGWRKARCALFRLTPAHPVISSLPGADVYIDDSPDNIAGLRAAGHFAICFANSANKGIEVPRARKWDEVYTLIKQRWPAPVVSPE